MILLKLYTKEYFLQELRLACVKKKIVTVLTKDTCKNLKNFLINNKNDEGGAF